MVSYKISYDDVLDLLKLPSGTKIEELDDLFSYAKCEIEDHDLSDDLIKIDCKTSNRPDLWGIEGLVREVSGITGMNSGLPDISAEPSGYVIEVDPKIKPIRPFIAGAVVRGLEFTDFLIKQIIQLQEKVDFSYGRKRKRSSIGIYNINMVKSPIKYEVVDRSFSFIPLGYQKKLSLDEILKEHEKGKEYAYILPTKGSLPILRDKSNTVLSMPPIINSNDVGRVDENTTDVLVEVTGTNLEVVHTVVNLVTQTLRDRGGKVSSVEIHYPPEYGEEMKGIITPTTEPYEILIDPKDIEGYLNLGLKAKDIIELLSKRRFNIEKQKNKLLVKYPPYRVDLLHWVDIAEEVAIAFGYMNIEPTQTNVRTVGRISNRTISENHVREILSGCSLQEVLTFTLISPDTITTKMGRNESYLSNCAQIANPVSLNYSIMRDQLFPGLLEFLSKNTHNEYPQYIFEVGETTQISKSTVSTVSKAAVVLAGTEVSFENIHSILAELLNQLGINSFKFVPVKLSEFITGRTAKIMVEGNEIGLIGEVHPQILENWQIMMPLASFEVDLSLIPSLQLPPLQTF